MALKRLTSAEMVNVSTPWTTNGTPVRRTMQSIAVLAGLLPNVDTVHKQLLGARPVESDPRLAEITTEAAEVDARHDALVRGTDQVLSGAALLAGDGARAREIEAARSVLTPEGLGLVSTSYRNEAGAATVLKARLAKEPGVKAVLASIVVDKKAPLTSFVNERIQVADKLGKLEDERAQLLSTRVVLDSTANVDARNAWIRTVNALLANAELADLTEDEYNTIFGALRQVEAKADRRGRAAPAEPTPGPADPSEPLDPASPVLNDPSAKTTAAVS